MSMDTWSFVTVNVIGIRYLSVVKHGSPPILMTPRIAEFVKLL